MRRPTCGTAVALLAASLTLSPHSCVAATYPQWCISLRSTCAWWLALAASGSEVSSISDSASGSISGGPHRKPCDGRAVFVSHMNPEYAGRASPHLWRAVGSVLKSSLTLRFASVIRGWRCMNWALLLTVKQDTVKTSKKLVSTAPTRLPSRSPVGDLLTSEELFTNSCNKFYEQAPKARRKTVATLDKLDICHRQKRAYHTIHKRVDTAPVGRGGTDPQASHSAQHQTVAPLA
jgi:hypothetical protein